MARRMIGHACLFGVMLALLAAGSGGATAATGKSGHPVEARGAQQITARPYGGTVSQAVNPLFRPILPQLRGVYIPVVLPTVIPRRTKDRLYVSVDERSQFSYIIDIGYTATCHGTNYCRFGELDGGPVGETPTIFDYPRGRQMRLRNGAPALYFPYSCGASCGDSVLVFQLQGMIYTITLKTGALKDLLAMANSVAPVAVQ